MFIRVVILAVLTVLFLPFMTSAVDGYEFDLNSYVSLGQMKTEFEQRGYTISSFDGLNNNLVVQSPLGIFIKIKESSDGFLIDSSRSLTLKNVDRRSKVQLEERLKSANQHSDGIVYSLEERNGNTYIEAWSTNQAALGIDAMEIADLIEQTNSKFIDFVKNDLGIGDYIVENI